MVKKLWCFLWGHKTVHKAYTGEAMPGVDRLLNREIMVPMYRWKKTPFCTRCGKQVHEGEVKEA